MVNQEIWKDIKDYEGSYQISNLGRVKSLSRKMWNGNSFWESKERILKSSQDKDGYLLVGLHKNNKKKMCKIHRLVAIHFIDNPYNKPEVNHIDGDKSNNCADNLEWVTSSENSIHAYKSGLLKIKKGKENPLHYKFKGANNPTAKKVKCITTGKIFETILEGANYYNIKSSSDIVSCCRGRQKSAGKHPVTGEKLIWEYLEDSE